ncbi:MAG: Nitrate/nitrite response regulator protein, partial [uncultured Thermomicrobiales bacterium]
DTTPHPDRRGPSPLPEGAADAALGRRWLRGRRRGGRRRGGCHRRPRSPAGHRPDGPPTPRSERHQRDPRDHRRQPNVPHPRRDPVRGRRFSLRRPAGRGAGLHPERHRRGGDDRGDPIGRGRPVAVQRRRRRPRAGVLRRRPARGAARLPVADRTGAGHPPPAGPGSDQRGHRRRTAAESEDDREQRQHRLRQTPGRRPGRGDRPRPRGGVLGV